LVKNKAKEYGVSAQSMLAVIDCESRFEPEIQSHHTYTERNVPRGYKVGDREQSYGLAQIHLPAHPAVTKEQALDPEFAIDFMAKNMKSNPNMWSCYRIVAMR
jgi:hypothetical protein